MLEKQKQILAISYGSTTDTPGEVMRIKSVPNF